MLEEVVERENMRAAYQQVKRNAGRWGEFANNPSRTREFDALYVGTRAVLLNETKSSPRASDARRFAEFLESGEFACYFPQCRKLPRAPSANRYATKTFSGRSIA